jgi:ABC-type multidrug transport system ATPase subunit
VPQETALRPDLPVTALLDEAYWLKRKQPGGSREQQRQAVATARRLSNVDQILNSREKKDQFADRFSGGQLKRLSLCLELVSMPDLLLLDEPNSGLDAEADAGLMATLSRDIAGGSHVGVVVIVTHSLIHLADQDWVIALGLDSSQSATTTYVAYCGPFAKLYAGLDLAPRDDSGLMAGLRQGRWSRWSV